MTREEVERTAKMSVLHNKKTILELPTGFGKTKLSLECIQEHIDKNKVNNPKILILVAKIVHIQTWRDEMKKWGLLNNYNVTIICYNSLVKECGKAYDYIICDECHHLSPMRQYYMDEIKINQKLIGLSATLSKAVREYFSDAKILYCRIKDAVKDDVLPAPKIIKIPLDLDNRLINCTVKQFNREITTTQRGAYKIISKEVEWYKNKFMHTGNQRVKNMWLKKAKDRLTWLSEQKENTLKKLLRSYSKQRVIIFCSSIKQTERLCWNRITSKSKSTNVLDRFNKKEIDCIAAVDILNEGVNLVDCQIGIFGVINASDIMSRQKVGRLLRHKEPIVVLPYFKDTREEELVDKIMEEYEE